MSIALVASLIDADDLVATSRRSCILELRRALKDDMSTLINGACQHAPE